MRELILVGGGHAHVQVLKQAAMRPFEDCRITLVLDEPVAVYSGMVPGFVAGQYQASELEIDGVPLARRSGARVVLSAATRVDAENRRIEIAGGRAALHYDLASLDVGSSVRGLEVPGVREYALPTRPIAGFVRELKERVDTILRDRSNGSVRVVVVGAGVGGVELSFALHSRLLAEGVLSVDVTLLHGGGEILPGSPRSLAALIHRRAAERGFSVQCDTQVVGVDREAVVGSDGRRHLYDLLVWVTGASPPALVEQSDLPADRSGFVRIRETLQVDGFDDLFAVGDCAALMDHPWVPKAGVYAVRQGPYLADNLRAKLAGRTLRRYRPQKDFLTLLNLGDGRACGSKWGRAFEGRWVMRLKDRIDRKFMRRFQVLCDSGKVSAEFPVMEMPAMVCGGCAAKVGQGVLDAALDRLSGGSPDRQEVALGLDNRDDAVAWRSSAGTLNVASIDLFSAFTDDPWVVGRAAAVNAVSDLLASGVVPRVAQAVVAIPEEQGVGEAEETLFQVLHGVRSFLDEVEVILLGGHTTTATKLMAGLVVDGEAESVGGLWRQDALQVGQKLILTRPLGTGVIFHADAHGRCRGSWLSAALASVQRSSWPAFRVLQGRGLAAATDITGFGLAGHAATMARRSRCCVQLDLAALPALPGALELLAAGERSTFHSSNEMQRGVVWPEGVTRDDARAALLFDPQTSGGLLIAVPEIDVASTLTALVAAGDEAACVVGEVRAARDDGAVLAVGS